MKLLLVLVLLKCVTAELRFGRCQDQQLQQDFALADYKGLWYEQYRDKGFIFERGTNQTAQYDPLTDNSVSVTNTELRNGRQVTASGKAVCDGPKCSVYFKWVFDLFSPFAGDYQVVYTDYTDKAIVYSCQTLLLWRSQFMWILRRNQQDAAVPNQQIIAFAQQRVPSYNTQNLIKS